jgi:uncharacterized protein
MPTWDKTKRLSNIKDHGLDFEGCEVIFDEFTIVTEDDREAYGEQRLNVVGWFKDCVVHMTYTERESDFHVISLRRAEKHEVKHYISEVTR